jgi:catechol 2,3-dioxygenase-like lactoylglutathione lyase family enzyme
MRWMRNISIFAVGCVFGMLMMQSSAAQKGNGTGLKLNHFGISVKNVDESINFYTKTMGFREAFSTHDKQGKLAFVYVQISRDTFLEIAPADADHPAGFTHVGLWADDVKATVAALRRKGVKVDEPIVGMTKAAITNVTDPNGARLELLEFPPESLQSKAMQAWK